jgi:dienelactone hydrolase
MELVNEHLDELVNFIIRPPRRTYQNWELGPNTFQAEGTVYKRIDFEVKNKRNQTLKCSQYYGIKHRKKMPVIIYCHGNSGCRLDAAEALHHLLKMEFSVVCFDFSGSGNSDGEFVTLGYYEKDDLEAVVEYLRKNDQTTRIGLWGRSMGAATSLMFGVSDPSVACMVLDSPFSSLKVLANELVTKNEVKLPKMVVSVAFKMLKKSIEKKVAFDIEKLEPIKSAPKCFIPALFAHANQDDFIDPSHSKNISEKYAGDFNLITFDGDHVTHRPTFFYDSVCIFFNNNLNITSDFGEDNPYIEEELSEEQLTQLQTSFKSGNAYQDEFERVRQMSLQEAYNKPSYVDEEDEQLQLALKLSLLENPETAEKEKEKESTTKESTTKESTKVESSSKDKDSKDPKDKSKKDKDKKSQKKKK